MTRDPHRRVDLARPFQIDANRINARGSLPNMSRLEKWRADGVIEITMADVAQREVSVGSAARARKADRLIFTMSLGEDDRGALHAIEAILFPEGARDQNQRNDALIVFHALKNHYRLITADGGILRHREELACLGATVMSDAEAVAWIEEEIRKRDERLRLMNRDFGHALPSWVGEDD